MNVEERVAKLERSARRWRLAAVLAGLGGVGLGAARSGVPDEIRAKRFVVEDGQGRDRIVLAASSGKSKYATIEILGGDDEESVARLTGGGMESSALSLSQPDGPGYFEALVNRAGNPFVEMHGSDDLRVWRMPNKDDPELDFLNKPAPKPKPKATTPAKKGR